MPNDAFNRRMEGLRRGIAEQGRQGPPGSADAYAEMVVLVEGVLTVIPETAAEIAEQMRAGDSEWPVDTGYSRDRWRATESGISNDADYAEIAEERAGNPALRFVQRQAQRVIDRLDNG